MLNGTGREGAFSRVMYRNERGEFMDLKEENLIKGDIIEHWYYNVKYRLLKRNLKTFTIHSLADIGAGSGFFSKQLLADLKIREAWLIDIHYGEDGDQTVNESVIHYRKHPDALKADWILMMDVIEHIEDDFGFLLDFVERSLKGSRFFITVPAFQFLFSGHDIYLEHFRRYTLKELESLCARAGLRVEFGHYYFAALFPLVALVRLVKRFFSAVGKRESKSEMSDRNPLFNGILKVIHIMELPFARWNRFFGLTAVVVCRKD